MSFQSRKPVLDFPGAPGHGLRGFHPEHPGVIQWTCPESVFELAADNVFSRDSGEQKLSTPPQVVKGRTPCADFYLTQMKTMLLFLLTVVGLMAQTYPEIRLNDGRTIKNVEVIGYSQSSFMAKWTGGKGTVAYDNLPEELRKEFENRRPNKSEATSETTKEPTAPTEGKITIGNIGLKAVDQMGDYVKYAWQAEVINGTSAPESVDAQIKLLDKDGFELETDYGETVHLRAGQRGTITGASMMKRALWTSVHSYKVKLR